MVVHANYQNGSVSLRKRITEKHKCLTTSLKKWKSSATEWKVQR